MKYRNLDNFFGLNRGEQARLARAKRESALPIGPLRGDVSPLNMFMDSPGKEEVSCPHDVLCIEYVVG